ncbi:MAG: hypothetical protein JWQ84_3498 [Mucilaginibacter sp.]|nr:hypothetical protein [Mucilaginibacter sp.]
MLNKRGKKLLVTRLIIIISLALAIFLLMQLASYPHVVEQYYSKGFYLVICRLLHPVFNIFPFSAGDILYLTAIAYIIYAFIKFIKLIVKKEFKEAGIFLLGIAIRIQSVILVFYLFWGMNYFRPSAGERLRLCDTSYTTAELKAEASIIIDSANACRARLTKADLSEDNSVIYQTAVRAINKLSNDSVNFRTYSPGIKPSILTLLLNYIGTSGYYNPFTSEAQINYQVPVFNRPVIACHEMSHQMGYGAEDEADFAGYLAGIGSNDRLLRYSAYHLAVDEFMHALYYRDSLANKELKPRISVAVHKDFVYERAYWRSYQSKIDELSGIFYDRFLKANNQPQGLATYNRMVLLVMAQYKNSIHR